MGMRFGVLGPLEVVRDGVPIVVSAQKQRIALAALLLEANRHVSVDRLAEAMWEGRDVPGDARDSVQTHIRRLRRSLTDDAGRRLIHTGEDGYVLLTDPGDVDVTAFHDLLARAERATDPVTESDLIGAALALWRGAALADVPSESLRRDHVPVLDEQRLRALERWFALQIRLGRHGRVIPDLRRATADHPLRERLWEQLMTALHRSGRQAEALQAYLAVDRLLREELGVDPGEPLRRLHREILTGTAEQSYQPRQLPADVVPFTGRKAQVAVLDGLRGSDRPVVVTGPGGVGKTALAVHWAHTVRDRFPDGQLYVDLRGFGPGDPLRPECALEMLLSGLGVPDDRMPAGSVERSALLRSVLAGRRVLLLLDNARDEAQVRPLLPGAGSLAVVTSRNQLRGLVARQGALRVPVDVLPPEETRRLLSGLLGREPAELAELADLCGGLPLAARIAAANIGDQPLEGYLADLREGNRLAMLSAGDDEASAVRTTFDLSYAALPEPERELFALLGLVPGAGFGDELAAALIGRPLAETRGRLDRLVSFHLIGRVARDRYSLHDLLRIYAAEHAPAAGAARLHDWYLHGALAAALVLHPDLVRLPSPAPVRTFTDRAQAAAWLAAEHDNLVALLDQLARTGPGEPVWLIADALRGHFRTTRRPADWLLCLQAAFTAAGPGGDPAVHAALHLGLADLYSHQDHHEKAIIHYTAALELGAGWPELRAAAQGGLGVSRRRLGDPRAATRLERAPADAMARLTAGERKDSAREALPRAKGCMTALV
ncbi:AfsR/SARP family transcriptional regulator [Herbidospora galbida]|uniref:AfsR/SARP family transcriptional regulator n=1 Tax=Herbidospora galbida TaxID=2575442 RepID=A0A4U3MPB6_9ACTN|nr:AfsR/SARP family transcriptional regulator [Herbidospora galbida]TKK91441.1 AfsR/SARP family transcriptional regulator [Herbidospora galbida]